MDTKKPPGRPRIYETASSKVDAFRKRQESAGYLRKEILVTSETWDRVKQLALGYGVGTADAASGLLEFGLETFETKATQNGVVASTSSIFASASSNIGMQSRSLRPASLGSFAVAPQTEPDAEGKLGTSDNPITQFFLKRKDQNNV